MSARPRVDRPERVRIVPRMIRKAYVYKRDRVHQSQPQWEPASQCPTCRTIYPDDVGDAAKHTLLDISIPQGTCLCEGEDLPIKTKRILICIDRSRTWVRVAKDREVPA